MMTYNFNEFLFGFRAIALLMTSMAALEGNGGVEPNIRTTMDEQFQRLGGILGLEPEGVIVREDHAGNVVIPQGERRNLGRIACAATKEVVSV